MSAPRAATWFAGALAAPLCAAAWVLWTRPRSVPPGPPPALRAPEPSRDAGFEGTLELGDGTRLAVLLCPLHAGADEQSFDGRALRLRLGLGEGQPWRLTLTRSAAGPKTTARRLEVRTPCVVDGAGACLSLPVLPARDPAAAPDPLCTLLASLEGELPPATSRSGILWGAAPRGAARLKLEREIELSPRARAANTGEAASARAGLAPKGEEH